MLIYGIINKDNCLIDVSKTERGAKQYATRNDYNRIGYRDINSYHAIISHVKFGKKWVKYLQE